MNAKTRVVVEICAPAMVGTVLLFVWKHEDFARTLGFGPQVILMYLAFAYAFGLIPSLLYAFVMERWLSARPLGTVRRLGAVGLSTLFGLGAGYAVFRASEAPVTWIGAVVGLILGLLLGLGAKSTKREGPNHSPEPTPGAVH